MSANATTARSGGLPRFYRRRTFWRNTSPFVALALAFVVGVVLFNTFGSHGGLSTKPIPLPTTPRTPKTVRISPKEMKSLHALVKEFVTTAVARKHLAQSYQITGPALREGISEKSWAAGNVTAVPYPVDNKTWLAFEKPDWHYANSVRFQVHVITPDQPNHVAAAGVYDFYVDLLKLHGRWVVNNWVPRWTPPIPNAS